MANMASLLDSHSWTDGALSVLTIPGPSKLESSEVPKGPKGSPNKLPDSTEEVLGSFGSIGPSTQPPYTAP